MAQENQYQSSDGAPKDRSTDTHRVVRLDHTDPIHAHIIQNPERNPGVLIKSGNLYFPKPVTHQDSPADSKPADTTPTPKAEVKAEPKAEAPVKKAPEKKAEPKKVAAPAKSETPVKTGMARNSDKAKLREQADAERNARFKARSQKK